MGSAAEQGDFRPGSRVTMCQNGVIATTLPETVSRGGDSFVLSSTFTIPQDSTQVCRTVVPEIGSVTLAEPSSNDSPLRCIPARR